jgi:hypothetical protein
VGVQGQHTSGSNFNGNRTHSPTTVSSAQAQSSSSSPPPPYGMPQTNGTNDPTAYQLPGSAGQPPLSGYRPPAPLSNNSRIIQPGETVWSSFDRASKNLILRCYTVGSNGDHAALHFTTEHHHQLLTNVIKPYQSFPSITDGFHTSASDPELQKKYGHTRNVVDIAPPPIFSTPSLGSGGMTVPPQQYSMYSQPTGQNNGPPTISRYVAYDPFTPSASTLAPIPTAQTYQHSSPASQPAVQMNTFQTNIMSNSAVNQLMGGTMSTPVQGSSSSYVAAVPDTTAFSPPHTHTQAPLAPHVPQTTPAAVAAPAIEGGGAASFFSSAVTPVSAAPQVTAAVAQQSTDAAGLDSLSDSFCEVEILDASSSSVL